MSKMPSTGKSLNPDILTKQPLVVILGATAIGKTRTALHLSKHINTEIIGADSRQVYTQMDIGTAKPTVEERAQVTHHLIDIIPPDDRLTLARYQQMAYNAIDDVLQRQKLPLLVGGTGQYISAVTEGWSIPEVPPNEALRQELETYADTHGSDALHQRLQKIDPEAAENIHPNNVRRVIRALEVSIETGTPITILQRKKPPPYTILEIGLHMERSQLYARSDSRIDRMMAQGLLDEVQSLLDSGYDRRLPSMSGLGYAQLSDHLLDGVPLEDTIAATKKATRDFIRRQETWFRGHDNGILWHNVQQGGGDTVLHTVQNWLTALV